MPTKSTAQTAEQKARLLLSREREVYDLRHARSRAEQWLTAVHALALTRAIQAPAQTLAEVLELLVGDLSFEVAAAFEIDRSGRLTLALADPLELPSSLRLSSQARQELIATPSGVREAGCEVTQDFERFAQELELSKYRWMTVASVRDTHFLFFAGFSARTAQFHRLPESDQTHFDLFCGHAASLLNNSLLLASLNKERRDLEDANRELDGSLAELQRTQQELIQSTEHVAQASRQAGMAEIATGILHNVGNVLNSVNVCSEVASDKVAQLPVEGFRNLVSLLDDQDSLEQFFGHDPRAPTWLAYLKRCSGILAEQQQQLSKELHQLNGHLSHVGAIVSRQQEYARPNAVEECELPALLDDALLLARPSEKEHGIRVERDYESLPPITLDKHRVLQILVNLITNSIQALRDSGKAERRLTARVHRDGPLVEMQIVDNGVGVAPEQAPNLFRHGYTTRAKGHGFGLHNSFLTAQELGGELDFFSAGTGAGATFTLRLPVDSPPPDSTRLRRPSMSSL